MAVVVPPATRSGLFRALQHANYRRYFFGQGVSLLGTWMQTTAMAWLVYRLTGSSFLNGANTFAGQIPWLLLLPVAGMVLDRCNRLHLVRVTQALSMIQAAVLAGLVFFGWVEIWHVMVLAFGLGCVNAFDLPARQALLPELLDRREDLSNAIALNSSAFNAARLIGPACAGLLVERGDAGQGEGWCFLLNAVSFLAVLVALAFVTAAPRPRAAPAPMLQVMGDGFRFVLGQPAMRALLLLAAIFGFIGLPYTVLVPVFAKDVLAGGPQGYGLLLTASGLGALVGAVYLASRPSLRGSASRIAVAGFVVASCFAAFALSRHFILSLALLTLAGMAMMLAIVSCNTIVQTIVPDDMRGRVMSLYNLALLGLTPLGSLLVGAVSEQFSPTAGMLLCAGGCLVGAALFVASLPAIRAAIRAHTTAEKLRLAAALSDPDLSSGEIVHDRSV
jgi:MFS family permease